MNEQTRRFLREELGGLSLNIGLGLGGKLGGAGGGGGIGTMVVGTDFTVG